VLDDGAGGAIGGGEFRHQFKGRVGVVDVVVGQFLALPLLRGGHAGAVGAVGIEGGLLVRVFAIAQGLGQLAGKARGSAGRVRRFRAASQVDTAVS
jgi:hypothetical protein